MKNILLNNWTFFRAIRLIMGIAIIIQAFVAKDILFGLAGLVFSGMALFNASCCGTSSCNAVDVKSNNKSKEITYEEVV